MAEKIKDYLHGYRADPTGKFGGKDRMETMPTEFDKGMIHSYISAMKAGKEYGVPQLSAEQLANMALHEGRDDFGVNKVNMNNPKVAEIVKGLSESGHRYSAAEFAGALLDKKQTADRLKIPFEVAWNGTGHMNENILGIDKSRTGYDYAKEAKATSYAASHTKNKELMDYINRSISDKLTPEDRMINKLSDYELNNRYYKFDDSLSPQAKHLLGGVEPEAIARALNNQVRDKLGVSNTPFYPGGFTPEHKQYNMDNETLAGIALTHPEIKAAADKLVANRVSEINKAVPEYSSKKVAMPEGYRHGGRVSLI